jgi:hypothetical protein
LQRTAPSRVHEYTHADDVRLTVNDGPARPIDPNNAAIYPADEQPNEGGLGTRRILVYMPPGQSAQTADGAPISPITIRPREYTVGTGGPESMPGSLPVASGYTFAMDLSVDGANGQHVLFGQPVDLFIENNINGYYDTAFLGLQRYHLVISPDGIGHALTKIPLASYDNTTGNWLQGGRSGNQIPINSPIACIVEFDATTSATDCGDAVPPLASDALAALRAQSQYAETLNAGKKVRLWRTQMSHFSASDWNLNWVLDAGAQLADFFVTPDTSAKSGCTNGSIIECENQTLGERLPIAGTPYFLAYNSARHPGRSRPIRATFKPPAVGVAGFKRAVGKAYVAGQELAAPTITLAADGTTTYEWFWDNKDGYGRTVLGRQAATVKIGYVYTPSYRAGDGTFADPAGYTLNPNSDAVEDPDRFEATLWKEQLVWLSAWDDRIAYGLQGFSVSPVHFYDASSRTLYRGDGGVQYSESQSSRVSTMLNPSNLTAIASRAGETYYADDSGIWLLGADGSPKAVAPTGAYANALAVDGTGNVFFAMNGLPAELLVANRLSDGTYAAPQVVVGGCDPSNPPAPATSCNGSSPALTSLGNVDALAMADDGWLYIADSTNEILYRYHNVGGVGAIEWFAGNGVDGWAPTSLSDLFNGSSRSLHFRSQHIRMALGRDGRLFVGDESYVAIVRTSDAIVEGSVFDATGTKTQTVPLHDGILASDAYLQAVGPLAVAPDGSLHIGYNQGDKTGVLRYNPDRTLYNVVFGDGRRDGLGGASNPAIATDIRAQAHNIIGLAFSSDGTAALGEGDSSYGSAIRRIESAAGFLGLPRSRRQRGYAAIDLVQASPMNFNSNSIGLT